MTIMMITKSHQCQC